MPTDLLHPFLTKEKEKEKEKEKGKENSPINGYINRGESTILGKRIPEYFWKPMEA